jgi:hypothetical protein
MSEIVIAALRKAIADRQAEIDELEARIREEEKSESGTGRRFTRKRKATGFRPGGLPAVAEEILRGVSAPLEPADLAARVSKKLNKTIETRVLAAQLKRYIDGNRVFSKTEDGLYAVKK